MKRHYSFSYVKIVTGTIVVTSHADDEAIAEAYDRLEDVSDLAKHHDAFYGTDTSSSVSELYLNDTEPDAPDRSDEL